MVQWCTLNVIRSRYFLALVACGAMLMLAGCGTSSSATPRDRGSNDRLHNANVDIRRADSRTVEERIAELETLGHEGAFEDAPTVYRALEDASPHVRKAAAVAAERIVGYGVPVNPYWSPERLHEARSDYERMHALAKELGVEHFVDTVPALIERMQDPSLEVRQQAYADVKRTTAIGYGFRPDASPEQRERVVAAYRSLWQHWQRDDARALSLLRDPDLRAEHKKQRVAELTPRE